MNFLTFIFSLLLIFSLGSFILLEKQAGNRRLRTTYLGHIAANRKILSKCESETYQSFRSIPKPAENEKRQVSKKEPPKAPPLNPECARFNLWPLIQEGKESHPFLYEATMKLLKTYYEAAVFSEKSQIEAFLNVFLKKAKEQTKHHFLSLEKLHLNPDLQSLYYKMLKGSKKWDFDQNIGYPSLLDVIKVEESDTKLCLQHAHPGQIAILFGSKAANKLYHTLHEEESESLSKEKIEQICSESHAPIFNSFVFNFIELKSASHSKHGKTTLIVTDQDSQVSIRKNIYTNSF